LPRIGERSELQIEAGRVGRPHGLDGSFYVTGARPRLLCKGVRVTLDGRALEIVRRAGTDERPIIRLDQVEDRPAAETLRGRRLTVPREHAPALEENEWWAGELEGCAVVDGKRPIGVVLRLIELPSCEVLEVQTSSAASGTLLVPMVRDAIRRIDAAAREIDIDMSFLEG
jgi:16S rRNA processing protein RimM